MPRDDDPEVMRRAEREVGDNIPEEMVGRDSEDARDVERRKASRRGADRTHR